MHSERSVLSAQCNSSALTVCVFLFNVTNNTVIVLLVSSLLILLSILLRCRRPVRLNVRLTTLYRRVSCKYRQFPRVSGEASRTCSYSAGRLGRELKSFNSWLHVLRCRKSWPVLLQISLIGRPSNLQPFCTQVYQTAPGCHPFGCAHPRSST